MLRITFNAVSRNVQTRLSSRYADLSKIQEQLSSGKRLLRPSDDPIDVSNDLKLRSKGRQLEQYKRNIEDGLGYMQVADTAMTSMNDLLQRGRELALQANNDTLSGKERLFISQEIEQVTRQMVTLGNTSFKGDYIFAGAQGQLPALPIESSKGYTLADYSDLKMASFDASVTKVGIPIRNTFDGSNVTNILPGSFKLTYGTGPAQITYVEGRDYNVDYTTGKIDILATPDPRSAYVGGVSPYFGAGAIPPGARLDVDLSAPANYQKDVFSMTFDYVGTPKDIFGVARPPDGDIFREIEMGTTSPINVTTTEMFRDPATGADLIASLISLGSDLRHNNKPGISLAITNIDLGFKLILSAQSKNGARVNRFETTLDRNDAQTTETTRLGSELEDADMAEVAMQFSVTQNVYNAALQSAAKIIQPSLANFL